MTLLVVLLAVLSAGCAAVTRPDPAGGWPISISDGQPLPSTLGDLPPGLRAAVTQAGAARLPRSGQAALDTAPVQELQAVLVDILTHTRNQTLLPDARFEKLEQVLSGRHRPLAQTFATALAGYLAEDDFVCQQPVYAEYFARRYGARHPARPCPGMVPLVVISRYDGPQIVWLDLARVQSIHLLFAGNSGSMASRFGHVALRLVVCPPGKTTAAECDVNLADHLVLGFQAHIDELSLDTLKALNGDYKAYLFANRFMDVYEDYAIGEFREVYSLPLRLDDQQREVMLRELADIHWRYAGDYRFFTRNCATMLQDALGVAWPEFARSDQTASRSLRPDGFFAAIKASPLVDSDKLASLEEAERTGHYFSSTQALYDLALSTVRDAMQQPTFANLDTYLQTHPLRRRQARAADQPFLDRLVADPHLRAAQIMLEEYSFLRSERQMMIEGARYSEQQGFLERADTILATMDAEHAKNFEDCLLAPIRQHTRPLRRWQGIPGAQDLPALPAAASACQSARSRTLLYEAIAGIKDAQSEQWQRLNEASRYWVENIANLKLLKQM